MHNSHSRAFTGSLIALRPEDSSLTDIARTRIQQAAELARFGRVASFFVFSGVPLLEC